MSDDASGSAARLDALEARLTALTAALQSRDDQVAVLTHAVADLSRQARQRGSQNTHPSP
jgi:hypothetical protein